MSWDSYLDNMSQQCGAGNFARGAIISLDGGSAWTTTAHAMGLRINPAEAQSIARALKTKDYSGMQGSGIMCEGQKFQYLRDDQDEGYPSVMGKKKGHGSITAQASKTAIVIGFCPEGGQQGNLNKGVSVTAKYLAGLGY